MQAVQCQCGMVVTVTKVSCRCSCGATVYAEDAEPQWIPGSPCRHRGEVLREMECNCAGGRKVVNVYACSVHSECTLRNTKAGTDKPHVCLGCEDWDGEV